MGKWRCPISKGGLHYALGTRSLQYCAQPMRHPGHAGCTYTQVLHLHLHTCIPAYLHLHMHLQYWQYQAPGPDTKVVLRACASVLRALCFMLVCVSVSDLRCASDRACRCYLPFSCCLLYAVCCHWHLELLALGTGNISHRSGLYSILYTSYIGYIGPVYTIY
jgi:hypothetical protein